MLSSVRLKLLKIGEAARPNSETMALVEYAVLFSIVVLPLTYLPLMLLANDRSYMRHADAGYDIAIDCAREQDLDLPMVKA